MITKLLCIALLGLIAVTLLGRAIDAAVEQHVFITRGGQTLDCERVLRNGRVVMEDCQRVAP